MDFKAHGEQQANDQWAHTVQVLPFHHLSISLRNEELRKMGDTVVMTTEGTHTDDRGWDHEG